MSTPKSSDRCGLCGGEAMTAGYAHLSNCAAGNGFGFTSEITTARPIAPAASPTTDSPPPAGVADYQRLLESTTASGVEQTTAPDFRDCDCAPCRIRAAATSPAQVAGTTIFVNGEKHLVTSPTLTYSQVVSLAVGPDGLPSESVLTITHSCRGQLSGVLGVCGAVWVREGMIFDVADTGRA